MFKPKMISEIEYENSDTLLIQNHTVKKDVENVLFLHLLPEGMKNDKPKFMHLCWNRVYSTFFMYMYRRFGTPYVWSVDRSLGAFYLSTPKKGVYPGVAFLTYGFVHIEVMGIEKVQKDILKEKRELHLNWQNGLYAWAKEVHNYTFGDIAPENELNERYHAFLIENGVNPESYDNTEWSEKFFADYRKKEEPLRNEYGKIKPYPNDNDFKVAQSCIKAALKTVDSLLQTTEIGDTDINLFGRIGEMVKIGDMVEFKVTHFRKMIADYFEETNTYID